MATAAKIDDQTYVWRMRCELAAAYRLVALFGWDDHIATHLSMRLPDGTFLLNPFGLMFDEITASSLMRLDMEGNLVEPCEFGLNPAGGPLNTPVTANPSNTLNRN